LTSVEDDPVDAEIVAHLLRVPAAGWSSLWSAVDELEQEDEPARWGCGQQIGSIVDDDGRERRVVQMPYVINSPATRRVIRAVHDLGMIVKFDWLHWDGLEGLRGPVAMEEAPVADAVRVLTAIIRGDRFVDGTIAASLADGTLLAVLRRIRRWHDEELDQAEVSEERPKWDLVFEPVPEVWGLRGDRFAWFMLRAMLGTQELPEHVGDLGNVLSRALAAIQDHATAQSDEGFYVPLFAHGGMSGGSVDVLVWREALIPLLVRRARALLAGGRQTPADDASARALAIEVARCPEINRTAVEATHPCRTIVQLQGAPENPQRQVPEAWAGGLLTARVLYVSSNPSISEAGDHNSGELPERYPRASWDDEPISTFIVRRFDQRLAHPLSVNDHFLREDGHQSPRHVPFWRVARKRSTELLGYPADPAIDYAMTEVVRCKSKKEVGVSAAAQVCAPRYLERTIGLCPAPLVVVIGSKARDRLSQLWPLSANFGREDGGTADHTVLTLGGIERLVAYLPHFTSMVKGGGSFEVRYGTEGLQALRDVALNVIRPEEFGYRYPK
jgi:hypothetical protein